MIARDECISSDHFHIGYVRKVNVVCCTTAVVVSFDDNRQTLTARGSLHSLFCRTFEHFKISYRGGPKLRGIVASGAFFLNNKQGMLFSRISYSMFGNKG